MANSTIPRRFIRIWLGSRQIPEEFEKWWLKLQELHPTYEFITITDASEIKLPENLKEIYENAETYASRSDILRIVVLYEMGGVYVDTDILPLKSFEPLLSDNRPFIGKRTEVSFESAVIGSPAQHPALLDLINALPLWYAEHAGRASSVRTGPTFISSVWFGRPDIRHLPQKTFYPFKGFRAPRRKERIELFSSETNFPPEMFCAHFSNHRWGGKPKP